MAITTQIPWTKQPQQVVGPVKDGPFSGPALLWSAANSQVNQANGALRSSSGAGTGTTEKVGVYGKEIDFSGSGTGRYIFQTPPEQDTVTFAIEARIETVTDLDRLVSGYNGASSGKYDIYYEGAAGLWSFQILRATTNSLFRFSSGLGTTFSGTLVVTCTVGSAPIAFFNGQAVGVSTITAGSGSTVASSNLLGIGGRPDVTTRQVDGGISTVWRLDRAITSDLAQALSRPNALYALLFAPRRIWVTQSVATGAYTLNAETGAYSLTGSNATLLKGLILDAASGSYTLTGSDATFVYNKLLNASSGSYSVSGADANLIYTPGAGAYTLNAESGAYVLTGSDVTFVYSGGLVTLKAGSWIRYRIIT